MIAVENLSISFNGRVLFRELGFVARAGERAALAGPNGAGKSTLLKLLMGAITPDSGKIIKAKTVQIGYLPQEGVEIRGRTLYDEAETAFGDVKKLERELEEASEALGTISHTAPEYEDALELFGTLQLKMEHHDIAQMRPNIEKILTGLGFKHSDFDRLTDTFSGGWQMRIALAKLLLQEPEVLLLDEPTNHLDIETVQWLEKFLLGYPGAILLISHDKRFLDMLTNRTLAFANGKVESYSGNYSFYLTESKLRREILVKAKANQEREMAKAQQFVDRFRAQATKATLVQSTVKRLAKIDVIELEDEEAHIGFKFPQPPHCGQTVMKFNKVSKTYDGKTFIFRDFEFSMDKDDRYAIMGVNGAGKSTFSKILSGADGPTSGERIPGHNVKVAYYSQDHADALDPTKTVLETAEQGITGAAAANIRNLLGCFLFRGDDVHKSVSVLSGGERGRLALCRLLLTPANFLILDEPTNHLDMRSQAVLQKALADYTGAFVIVSHNRDFLDPIVNKVLEFRPAQAPRQFYGNLSYYLDKKAEEARALGGVVDTTKKGNLPTSAFSAPALKKAAEPGMNPKERRRLEAQKREERGKRLKPLQASLAEIEKKIAALEADKKKLTERLQAPDFGQDNEEVRKVTEQTRKSDLNLEVVYGEWSKISEEIELLKAD